VNLIDDVSSSSACLDQILVTGAHAGMYYIFSSFKIVTEKFIKFHLLKISHGNFVYNRLVLLS
jgi:hypothetical protein